jgi:FKBP-type peptidyl-prolyl cis-trans isomerase 2
MAFSDLGSLIDRSPAVGQPLILRLSENRISKALTEALLMCKKGQKVRLVVPKKHITFPKNITKVPSAQTSFIYDIQIEP